MICRLIHRQQHNELKRKWVHFIEELDRTLDDAQFRQEMKKKNMKVPGVSFLLEKRTRYRGLSCCISWRISWRISRGISWWNTDRSAGHQTELALSRWWRRRGMKWSSITSGFTFTRKMTLSVTDLIDSAAALLALHQINHQVHMTRIALNHLNSLKETW